MNGSPRRVKFKSVYPSYLGFGLKPDEKAGSHRAARPLLRMVSFERGSGKLLLGDSARHEDKLDVIDVPALLTVDEVRGREVGVKHLLDLVLDGVDDLGVEVARAVGEFLRAAGKLRCAAGKSSGTVAEPSLNWFAPDAAEFTPATRPGF